MKNHIYEVDWNYPGNEGWGDLHQYIVVYDQNSELGEEIEHHLFDEDDIKNLDVALKKAFGIRDEEVCFYYGLSGEDEPKQEQIKKWVEEDADIIVKKFYDKDYERE